MATDAAAQPSLAALLRGWRNDALLTQEQLAARAGLAVRTIRRLEADGLPRPRTASVRLLADALELTDAERAQLIAAARGHPAEHAPHAAPMPRQLPADVAGFTGRGQHLRDLDALLTFDGDAPTAVVIMAIAGTAGVGKTALAVHWAHQVTERFPDGQLYVNLRGFGPGGQVMPAAEGVRRFLDALGVPSKRIPVELGAQAALYRSLLAGKRVLVVLDNARDAEQVRPLLPGGGPALVVVTSRSQLTGLVAAEGAHPLTLGLLTLDEARELLERRLGPDRVAAEPQAVAQIIDACARLPLALAIAAARAAQTGFPLTVLAAELADAHGRLGDAATRVRACSPGPTPPCPRRRPGCSGCWACTPARTFPPRRQPAWPACPWPRPTGCWPNSPTPA